MSGKILLAVAFGGGLGSMARYAASVWIGRWAGAGFPWGTLAVNIFGSMMMGVLIETAALHWSMSQEMRAFLTVGLLGGFTTFSTFSLDFVFLVQRGQVVEATAYALVSVAVSVAALYGGMTLVRNVV